MIEVSIEPRQFAAGRDCDLEVRFRNMGRGTCTDIIFKLGMPSGFLLLRGRNRLEIAELGPGQSRAQNITVRAREPGAFNVTSANFSYRNEYGTPVRVPDFQAGLNVMPGDVLGAPASPDLGVAVASGELALGEWDFLRFPVRNTTPWPVRNLTLTVGGPVRVAPPGPQARIRALAAGDAAEVSFLACPTAAGLRVPVQVHVAYTDRLGRARSQADIVPLVVRSQPHGPARTPAARPDTILFLAASPADLPPLQPDKEMREIRAQLQVGKDRVLIPAGISRRGPAQGHRPGAG